MSVTVYTQPGCSPCQSEKEWLHQQGIAFQDRNIRTDEAYRDQLLELGSRSTPTTVIEEGAAREIVIGFDRERLAKLLHLA